MRKELLTFKDPKSPVSEVFRTLRTNIQFMNTNRKLKTLLVTSTFPEEGKSWITSNLAVTFAQAGKRVILVDADMRKGRQYNIFGVLPKPGLSNYLSNMDADNNEINDVNIVNYIQETDVENLHILTAGNVPPNPSELLVSHRMRELLQELKNMCDLVVIDGTPCDLVTDALILSRIVDSTIVVAAQKETKKDNLVRIVKNIQNVGGRIAGVVLNKVDISARKYNQSYYYGSVSGNGTSKKNNKSKKEIEKMEGFITNLFKNSPNEEKIDDGNKEQEQEQKIEDVNPKKEEIIENIQQNVNTDFKAELELENGKLKAEEFGKDNIPEYVRNDNVQEYVKNDNVQEYVKNDNVPEYVRNDSIPEYVKNDNVPEYVRNDSIPEYVKNDNVPEYVRKDNIPEYVKNDNVPEYVRKDNIPEYVKNDIVQETFEKYNVNDIVVNIKENVNKEISEKNKEVEKYNNEENYQSAEEYQFTGASQTPEEYKATETYQTMTTYNPVEEDTKIEYDIYRNENQEDYNKYKEKEYNDYSIEQQEKEEYRRIKEQIKNNNKNYKKNKKKNKNKKRYNEFVKEKIDDNVKNDYYENSRNNAVVKRYQETEATVQEEGKISEIKIEKNMDEKTKEILRQVNEYIEAEKKRQGEKY